jgi:ribosome biogenesis SPOUT family RNA methylase Rps3
MTTDTAVRVTRIVVQDKIPLEKISYVDHPEIRVDAHESTTMPFRYVVDKDGGPIMPGVSFLHFSLERYMLICPGNDRFDQEGFRERN